MLTVSVHPGAEARLRRLAQDAGKDVTAYVAELHERAAPVEVGDSVSSGAQLDRALDELFATDERPLPAVSTTYPRDEIYLDHD